MCPEAARTSAPCASCSAPGRCSRIERVCAAPQCFYCPVVRHLWWWLGGRPASASVMRAMLSRGHSALVCPGGVRECLYMEHGREAVYLSNRTGFVRIALQYGAPSF